MSTTFIETVVQGNTQSDFSVPFTYITESDVKVYVDGEIQTGYTFTNGSLITFTTPPTDGSTVLIRRETDATTKAVDFQSGAMLTESDLDTAFDQVFNLAQETKDVALQDFRGAKEAFEAVGEYLTEINTVADDLGHGAITHIDFGDLTSTTATPSSDSVIYNVYTSLSDITAINDNETNLNAVAEISEDVTVVAGLADEIGVIGTAETMALITSAADPASLATMATAKVIVDSNVLQIVTDNLADLQAAGDYALAAAANANDVAIDAAAALVNQQTATSKANEAVASATAASTSANAASTAEGVATAQALLATTKADEAAASALLIDPETLAALANQSNYGSAPLDATTYMTVKGTELLPTGFTITDTWEVKSGTELVVLELSTIASTGEQFSESTTVDNHVFQGILNIMSEAVITINDTLQGFGDSTQAVEAGGAAAAGLSIDDVNSAIAAVVLPRHYFGGLGA